MRARRTAALLRQGVSLAQVAVAVRFLAQSDLNRHFLKGYGISPGA